jgi:hypothetical protein
LDRAAGIEPTLSVLEAPSPVRSIAASRALLEVREGPLLWGIKGRSGSILLKNSVSMQGRKISGDMARLDREVPRAYRLTAISLRESSRIASAKTCPQLSLPVPAGRKNARSEKPSFSTE